MDISAYRKKEVGALGEKVAAEYLRRQGMTLVDKNVARKTGEIDLIAREGPKSEEGTLHFVEVKTILCDELPTSTDEVKDEYDPSINIHEAKVRKVARTGEWYVMQKHWEGDWQVDAVLVWLRRSDGMAKVRYLPQIV